MADGSIREQLLALGSEAVFVGLAARARATVIARARAVKSGRWEALLFAVTPATPPDVKALDTAKYVEVSIARVASTPLDSPERKQLASWLEAIEQPLKPGHVRVKLILPAGGVRFYDQKVDGA